MNEDFYCRLVWTEVFLKLPELSNSAMDEWNKLCNHTLPANMIWFSVQLQARLDDYYSTIIIYENYKKNLSVKARACELYFDMLMAVRIMDCLRDTEEAYQCIK